MNALGAAGGVVLDAVAGEPPRRWHPVAAYGSMMTALERRSYRDGRRAGVVHLAIGVGAAVVTGWCCRRVLGPLWSTVVATGVASAGRMLDGEALAVGDHLVARDLGAARSALSALAGRRADDLDESEVARAVVESVAENSVDAVVSSIFWAAIGGAPAVLAHRAVNTLDAMVGHRTDRYERFGRASARLDDLANFVPARLAALSVAMCRPRSAGLIMRTVRRDAGRHPSPNGGVIEAAYAAALGLRLGGVNRYGDEIEDRGTLGDGRSPVAADITAAVRLRRHTTALIAASVALLGLAAPGGRVRWQRVRF